VAVSAVRLHATLSRASIGALTLADKAFAMAMTPPRIFWRVLVAVSAVCFLGIFRRESNAALNHVYAIRNGFQMDGIDTSVDTTEMVDNDVVRECLNKHLENKAGGSLSLSLKPEMAVVELVGTSSPQPARRSVPVNTRVDLDFREKADEKVQVDGNAVRIIGNHLRLLCSFDGLGFRGAQCREAPSF